MNNEVSANSPTAVSPHQSRMRYSAAEHRKMARRGRFRAEGTAWAFLGPMYLFFLVFMVIPVLFVIWWSFQQGGLMDGSHFVGFQNYLTLPNQPDAVAAVENTLRFAVMAIPAELVCGLVMAMLLVRVRHGGSVYRFLIYFPSLVPGVVAALMWYFLTNVDFGLLNNILGWFGIKPQVWLGSGLALPVLANTEIWTNAGFWAIFFLAALIGLPPELYEAGEMDGASAWQRLIWITLPQLRRVATFAIVVGTIWGLQVFDTPYVLTKGGPGTETVTVVYKVYSYVFGSPDKVGSAATISVVLLVVILILTLIQLRALRGREEGV